jgi:signal transduction histidine kinase
MRLSLISVRLIVAISLLGAVTCGALLAALVSFESMREGYDRMATETVPQLIGASRISQTAQSVASTAPGLASVESTFQRLAANQRIADQVKILDGYLDELEGIVDRTGRATALIGRIRETRDALVENLRELDATVGDRIALEATLDETYASARLIVARLRDILREIETTSDAVSGGGDPLVLEWYAPMQEVMDEVLALPAIAAETLVEDAGERARLALDSVGDPTDIAPGVLSQDLAARLRGLEGEARWLTQGNSGVFGLVRAQLSLLRRQNGLLNANKFLANRFVGSVADLTLVLREDTLDTSLSFAEVAQSQSLLLFGVMVFSVLAVISLSLYARTRVLRRLTSLRESLMARVEGRDAEIPADRGDEIGDIGQAAKFFADALAEREQRLVTAKDEAEDLARAAEAANRAKSVFLANMSHELRTPLNAIIGFSELISAGGSERVEEYAQDINDSGRHLLDLINQLLDYSKIEAGERDLSETEVRVADEFAALGKLIYVPLQRRNLRLAIDADAELTLVADRTAFRQVVLNLLANACKFAFAGSEIRLSATSEPRGIAIRVADKGVGIAREHLQRVMQPFHQETESYVRPSGGAGLGLAIVDTLTRLHGGLVEIESEKDVGTTVTALFPRVAVFSSLVRREAPAKDPAESEPHPVA